MLRRIRPFTFVICVISVFILSAVMSESMVMSPHKIILNANLKGKNQDIQAVIGMPLPTGYVIDDFDITLSFDGIDIAKAINARYCYVDDNLLVTFDREGIQNNPDVVALAGKTVEAKVVGTLLNPDNVVVNVSGSDSVIIIDPDKK